MATGLNNLSITIPRAKLMELLEERRELVAKEWDEKIEEARQELANATTVPVALAAWHKEVAALIDQGAVTYRADGSLYAKDEDVEIPDRPSASRHRTNKRNCAALIEDLETRREAQIEQYNASIQLLSFATNTDVEVPVGEYEALLSGRASRGRYYY